MYFLSLVNFFLGLVATTISIICTCNGAYAAESFIPPISEKKELPKNPFRQNESAYQNMGEGALALRWAEPKIELPDLKNEIGYYGKNERPDYKEKAVVHVGLKSSNESAMAERGKPIYLLYEFIANRPRYHFSKNPTALWLEIKGEEGSADSLSLVVTATDEKGALITEPENCRTITLPKEELPGRHCFFEMSGIRADASLLYRQKAHFVGVDHFFERHGGKEYPFTQNRERIDFEGEEKGYSCFIKEGDYLFWKDNRWQMTKEPKEADSLPILAVKRIDDKLVSFDLWDGEGKIRVALNLPRDQRTDPLPDITNDFKFVGAKTWAQFIVDCKGERMLLRLNEWLLLTPEGWRKIQTEKELDDYIDRKVEGVLFVLDKWERREGKQYLLGHLFNVLRNEVKEIELPAAVRAESAQPNSQPPPPVAS